MRLPDTLSTDTDETTATAISRLSCFYGTGRGGHREHARFPGAWFDTWDPHGTREADADRFTADDLYAVSFLSVQVHPAAGHKLLVDQSSQFTDLLFQLSDQDLVELTEPLDDDWVGWQLMGELDKLWGVGSTIASKLLARKRPRLRPIWDDRVRKVIGGNRLWEPLRARLQEDPDLHPRLLRLREAAGLPAQVSAIRVFDVLTWMDGTHGGQCPNAARGGGGDLVAAEQQPGEGV